MDRWKLLGLVCTLLLLPQIASAEWAKGCKFTTPTGIVAVDSTDFSVIEYGVSCYRYQLASGAHSAPQNAAGVITPVAITAQTALICFDPDILQTITTTARVIPHHCPQSFIADPTSAATALRSCVSLGGANGAASLDGTEGTATTQNACVRVGPGSYYFEISAGCEAGDTCQVSVKGEGK